MGTHAGLHALSAVMAEGPRAPETQLRVLAKPLGRLTVPPGQHNIQLGPQDELLRGLRRGVHALMCRKLSAWSPLGGEHCAHESSDDSYCPGRGRESASETGMIWKKQRSSGRLAAGVGRETGKQGPFTRHTPRLGSHLSRRTGSIYYAKSHLRSGLSSAH